MEEMRSGLCCVLCKNCDFQGKVCLSRKVYTSSVLIIMFDTYLKLHFRTYYLEISY